MFCSFVFHFNFFIIFILSFGILFFLDKKKQNNVKELANNQLLNQKKLIEKKNEITDKLSVIINQNNSYTSQLPEIFNDSSSIAQLYNLFETGQVDTMKEAYNLLETRYRHAEQMDALNSQFNILNENNTLLREQLSVAKITNKNQQKQLKQMEYLAHNVRELNYNTSETSRSIKGIEETFVPYHKRK